MDRPTGCSHSFIPVALLAALLITGGLLAMPAWAGDDCATATEIPFGGGNFSGDLDLYQNDYDPGASGCTGVAESGKDGVYVAFFGCSEGLEFWLSPVGFDAAIYVVTDCNDIAGTCIAGADLAGVGGGESLICLPPQYGTYYIIVDAREPNAGGLYTLDASLTFFDFPPGACCFADGHCEFTSVFLCQPAGGISFTYCLLCEPNPCQPTPAEQRSWGRIKEEYR
jgi:hypothetical protein